MFQKLRTVIFKVKDIAAAKAWYTEALGLPPYFDEPFYVGFDINGFELGLDPNPSTFSTGNQTVSYWSVEDTAAASDKLVKLGGKLIQGRTNVGGPIHIAIVEDPFGNEMGLIEGA